MTASVSPERRPSQESGVAKSVSTRRRGSELIGQLDAEHRMLIDSFMPSSVSFGVTQISPHPSSRSTHDSFDSIGAGFVVSSNEKEAIIATARHVALKERGPQSVRLQIKSSGKGPDGSKREGKMISPQLEYISNDHDVAFYTVKAEDNPGVDLQQELPAAPLGSAKDLQALEEVILIGSPYSFEQTTIIGHMTHDSELLWPIKRMDGLMGIESFIQIDSDMGPGNSGGMVISAAKGEIIGMSTAIIVDETNGNIAPQTGMATTADVITGELTKYMNEKASLKNTDEPVGNPIDAAEYYGVEEAFAII